MQRIWRRAVMFAVSVPTAMAVLSGCGVLGGSKGTISLVSTPTKGGSSSAPAITSAPATTSAIGVSASPGSSGSGEKGGCSPGGPAVPENADQGMTADLDGDGKADTLWLGFRGDNRTLGVTTASGARFSTSFNSQVTSALGNPIGASAVAGRLGDGSAVIMLDFGQEAKLYAVTDCRIVPSLNTQGKQYSFDRDVTGYGSGAGCPVLNGQGVLVGYLAKPGGKGDGYIVTQTMIDFSKGGTRAENGTVTTVDEGQPESAPVVKRAKSIRCTGERVLEPAS